FYFVEGHGEHSIEDTEREGYSFLKETLEKQGFAVKKLLLLSEKRIPEDADVVIIGGPQRPFTDEERMALENYLDGGGQLFVLLDPMVKTDLEQFFSKWGARLEEDIILDPMSGLGGAIPIINPGGYLPHEITKQFNLATFYPLARSVSFDTSLEDKFLFEPFLQTSQTSWLTKQVVGDLAIDPARDKKGPITIGGVISDKERFPGEAKSVCRVKGRKCVLSSSVMPISGRTMSSAHPGTEIFSKMSSVGWHKKVTLFQSVPRRLRPPRSN
ncbi:MAG: Gldg family protein, partial [Nitrospiria bacterium]